MSDQPIEYATNDQSTTINRRPSLVAKIGAFFGPKRSGQKGENDGQKEAELAAQG